MRSKTLIYFIMFLSGLVVGSLVSSITSGIDFLNWLSYGMKFGTEAPLSLDLGVISFVFGLNINLTISSIICILIAFIIARKVL